MTIPNIIIYANCQSKGIKYFLNKVIEGNIHEITNYEHIQQKKELPINILKNADVFIFQPIDVKHGVYSTDSSVENSICTHLKPSCKKISLPYIYNSAFWSFIPTEDSDLVLGSTINTIKPIRDLKKNGYSLNDVVDMFMNGKVEFNYEERFKKCMDILIKKEELCDVKVSDFILANVRNVKLFLTQNHPTTCVYIHCINQILKLLGHEMTIKQDNYDPNLVGLPGNYAHTTYDMRFWKFKYPTICNDFGWIKYIENAYNSIKD
jgi:hypothetical protein